MQELSPLDGRYLSKTEALRPFFSEEALHRARLEVEIRYLIALGREKNVPELPKMESKQEQALLNIIEKFDHKEAEEIKKIEKKTNHDVKAVEYYLKKKVWGIAGLRKHTEFIHFGLTSEDVNNLSYGILVNEALERVVIPSLQDAVHDIKKMAKSSQKVSMLSLTHGQPATPTTVGKEFTVFVDRLERQLKQLSKFSMQGKLGGAVGNFSAHKVAYPSVNWASFGKKFVASLGLDPLTNTTQINPHDDLAEVSHMMVRINTIMIDLSRDVWSYISRGIFKQKIIKGEVGSSTMPHKVNPIDFENAEGNLGLSTALFTHFAEKLPISRMQRDLSDSTVQRNIGVAFGYHMLSVASLCKGLSKLSLNKKAVQAELDAHPEVLAEAIQTVLRKHGTKGAYEKLKAVTRGAKVSKEDFVKFIATLKIPQEEKDRLTKMCR
jgi:adenylosuccinate lyase